MQLRLRARFGRLQRSHKVAGVLGVAIAAVSIALVVFTMRWQLVVANTNRMFVVSDGAVWVLWDNKVKIPSPLHTSITRRSSGRWVWVPSTFMSFGSIPASVRVVQIPLWMFFPLGLGVAAPAVLRMRRMRFANACSACDYDRAGIPEDATCPECGQMR